MEAGSWILVGALVVLVALSAFFSATETAFSSLNRIRIKNMADNGNKKAALALKLEGDYDKLLSTILIGNNIVNIASASISTVVFVGFLGDIGVPVSTVAMTVVVLIFGEISPKSLAKQNAEAFAMFSAPVLRVAMVLFTPLNCVFMQWKKLLNRIFRPKENVGITGEELLTIVDEVESEGNIDAHEGELIRAAIEFEDSNVEDILTPRVEMAAVSEDSAAVEVKELFLREGYSRLPVYRDTTDTIIGIIHEKELYAAVHEGTPWQTKLQQPLCVPEGMKISALLHQLQQTKAHMAIVVDEFGGTCGLVTMEDILEELVGEIWDEHDEVEEDFHRIDDGTIEADGGARAEDLFELLGLEEACSAQTVSGWVMEKLGSVPREGDAFEHEGRVRVTVLQVENRRAQRVRVTRLPGPPEESDVKPQ